MYSNNLNILLVEDDISSCLELQKAAENFKDINIIKVVDNSYDALSVFVNFSNDDTSSSLVPNVIILDLELNDSESGIRFLHELEKLKLSINPFILVTTNNTSKIIHDNAEEHGADMFIYKTSPDYSPTKLLKLINSLGPSIISNFNSCRFCKSDSAKSKEKLVSELIVLGFSTKRKALNYITDSILQYAVSPDNFLDIVASKYRIKRNSLEMSLRREIERVWLRQDPEVLLKQYKAYIHPDRNVPTLLEFVSYYAGMVQNF